MNTNTNTNTASRIVQTVRELEPFEIQKLDGEDVDVDEFDFVVDPAVQPRMMDDVITINTCEVGFGLFIVD